MSASAVKDPIPPVVALFPSSDERMRLDDYLTRELLWANERVARGSVVPTLDIDGLRSELAHFDFRTPVELEELLPWTIAQLEKGVVHLTNPRYFGLFNPSPSFPALCGDRLTGAFNPQLATATTSPAAVEIESHVIRAIARRAGLPPASRGHFTSGGSEANYTAVLCALTRANDRFALEGARSFSGQPVFYISRESHLAWVKIAHQAGIGRRGVRQVPTDGRGRMDANALARMLNDDAASGCVPVLIVATAGTTNAGMIDPIGKCADLARDRGLWLHVDAAWGGAVLASERLRDALSGIERATSITIDAHKWLATTMGCGMFITRDPEILASTFQVSTGFMPSNTAMVDPYVTTAQWSRRFLGLRLFLSLGAAGWPGYAQHVERSVDLIASLRESLKARRWRIANDSSLAVLCVEPPLGAPDARTLAKRVLASGRAWVAVATYEGRDVIRICLTHGEATIADIHELVAALTDACSAVPNDGTATDVNVVAPRFLTPSSRGHDG
ncbi:MAG TPA: pyridoxal-dependent decarboxylase [Gemmatimonadaceae bacterium]|jgi:glutamate/tyrosine decarboxylase-like PLP-dependent enzyme